MILRQDKMVFIDNQLNCWFTNGPQMALTVHTNDRLSQLYLVIFDDFEYFKDDQLEKTIKII